MGTDTKGRSDGTQQVFRRWPRVPVASFVFRMLGADQSGRRLPAQAAPNKKTHMLAPASLLPPPARAECLT